jgi:hypothetical protein
MRLQITQDGDYIVVDGNGNDALKIEENRNGTLEIVFLSTGAWSVGQQRLYGDKKTTVGVTATKHALSVQPTVHPARDFNQDHDWHYREDPYHYITGVHGLTIAESAERAVDKIIADIWNTYGPIAIGDEDELFGIVGNLLARGVGRNYIYRVAGRAKNERKPFSPVTLVRNFELQAQLDGHATS